MSTGQHRVTRWACVLATIGLGALSAACGIATGAPKAVPSGQVPAQIVSPTLAPGSPTSLPGGVSYNIYLINIQGTLQAYPRTVSVKGGLSDVLGFLVEGPDEIESQQGVQTAIVLGTQILSVTLPPKNATAATNLVTVNFNSVFAPVASSVQAVEQVVYTVDEALTPTVGVLFEIANVAIEVPRGDGSLTALPVTVANYPGAVAS